MKPSGLDSSSAVALAGDHNDALSYTGLTIKVRRLLLERARDLLNRKQDEQALKVLEAYAVLVR